jgi:hypothetical protein
MATLAMDIIMGMDIMGTDITAAMAMEATATS